MSDIYLYGAEETDFDNIGLCGALLPNEAKFSEIANGNATLTLTHPRDEYGKFALIERGMILKAAVPVRTTPEITNGEFVTTVYEYTVSSTATKEQRKIWNTRDKTKQKRKCLKVAAKGDTIVVVKTFDNQNYFTKVKYTYKSKKKNKTVTGFIDPAALQGPAVSKVIPATPAGMDSVADSWNVKDQLFRIENVEKTESEVNVTAHHISYDFMYNLTSYNFDGSKTLQEALDGVFGNCFEDHGFDAQTNIQSTLTGFHYADKDPITAMMDPDIGLVSRFDGELVRDNYMFTILDHAGTNRGYRIEYGKNMTGISWQIDETSVAGAIRPYGETKKGNKLYLDHSYIANDDYTSLTQVSGDDKGLVYSPRYYTYTNGTLTNTLPYTRIYAFQGDDCKATVGPNDDPEASDITEAMVRTRLKDQSLKALKDGADVPDVSISVDIKQLGNSVQYADFAELEKVFLFDTVLVYHRRMGILADAVVSAIEWDVIQDELVGITLGTIRDLSQSIASWQIVQINGGKIMPSTIPGSAILPGTISAEKIIAKDITADQIAANTITVDKLYGNYASFNDLVTKNLTAESIHTKMIQAEAGTFDDVVAQNLTAEDIHTKMISAETGTFNDVVANNIATAKITANNIDAGTITAEMIDARYANLDDLVAGHIATGSIDADAIDATTIATSSLEAEIAGIAEAQITTAKIDEVYASTLQANYAHLNNGVIDNATISYANVDNLQANYAHLSSGVIDNATISYANVNQLSTGVITAVEAELQTASIDYLKSTALNSAMATVAEGKIALLNAKNIKVDDTVSAPYIIGQDGYFTGAINAGTITAGTLVTDRLLLRGPSVDGNDSVVYQLNVLASGDIGTEITQADLATTEYKNHIHAENLVYESITAQQIHAGTIDVTKVTDGFGAGLIIESNESILSLITDVDAMNDAIGDTGELSGTISSMVKQNADGIETLINSTEGGFTEIRTTLSGLDGRITRVDSDLGNVTSWFQFTTVDNNPALTMGTTGNNFSVKLTNTRLGFWDGNDETAYISNRALNINDGEIVNSLKIGRFRFVPNKINNHMSLVYAAN